VPPSTAAVASSPKLLDRVRWHLRVKHYSIRTEQAYVDWIRRYILFHRKRHPNEMGEREITEFLTTWPFISTLPLPHKIKLSLPFFFFTNKCLI
jgi:Phage integrase, N-terminal SAM-like domain